MPKSKKRKSKSKSQEDQKLNEAHQRAKKATASMALDDEALRAIYLLTYSGYMFGYTVEFDGDLKLRPLRMIVKEGDKEINVSNYTEYFEPCGDAAALLRGMGFDEKKTLKTLASTRETRAIAGRLKPLG